MSEIAAGSHDEIMEFKYGKVVSLGGSPATR